MYSQIALSFIKMLPEIQNCAFYFEINIEKLLSSPEEVNLDEASIFLIKQNNETNFIILSRFS
jgi:hypothetical protein